MYLRYFVVSMMLLAGSSVTAPANAARTLPAVTATSQDVALAQKIFDRLRHSANIPEGTKISLAFIWSEEANAFVEGGCTKY
jgi:hypothetical protein